MQAIKPISNTGTPARTISKTEYFHGVEKFNTKRGRPIAPCGAELKRIDKNNWECDCGQRFHLKERTTTKEVKVKGYGNYKTISK